MPIHPLWILVFLAVVAAVAALVVVLAVAGRAQTPTRSETPADILARRFASGEITAEEYQKARDLLQGGRPTAT